MFWLSFILKRISVQTEPSRFSLKKQKYEKTCTESLPGIRKVGGHRAVSQGCPKAPERRLPSYVSGSVVIQQPCLSLLSRHRRMRVPGGFAVWRKYLNLEENEVKGFLKTQLWDRILDYFLASSKNQHTLALCTSSFCAWAMILSPFEASLFIALPDSYTKRKLIKMQNTVPKAIGALLPEIHKNRLIKK